MTSSHKGKRFIFIGGPARSGTTLMQNILDSHPDILGGPEFLHLPDIISIRKKLYGSINKKWIDHFCSYNDVDRLTSDYIENLLLPLADRHNCKLLSEKSPNNVLIFKELRELFPDARFINMVRDPRAIVASMLQVGSRARKKGIKTQKFTTNIAASVKYIQQCFDAGFAAAEVAPDRVLTVVYERLVISPQVETKKLCDFLEIEWSPHMVNPSQVEHLGKNAITVNSKEIWYNTQTYNRDPDSSDIEKWKTMLTTTQKVFVTTAFSNCERMTQFGYDITLDDFKTGTKLYGSFLFHMRRLSLLNRLTQGIRKLKSV